MTAITRTLAIGALSRTDFVRFAGAGGDFNPIHHDDAAARDAGFPSSIAMGMLTASLASKLITDWVGINAVQAFEVRFRALVLPGQALSVTGTLAEHWTDPSGSAGRIEFQLSDTTGEVKLTGTATVRLVNEGVVELAGA